MMGLLKLWLLVAIAIFTKVSGDTFGEVLSAPFTERLQSRGEELQTSLKTLTSYEEGQRDKCKSTVERQIGSLIDNAKDEVANQKSCKNGTEEILNVQLQFGLEQLTRCINLTKSFSDVSQLSVEVMDYKKKIAEHNSYISQNVSGCKDENYFEKAACVVDNVSAFTKGYFKEDMDFQIDDKIEKIRNDSAIEFTDCVNFVVNYSGNVIKEVFKANCEDASAENVSDFVDDLIFNLDNVEKNLQDKISDLRDEYSDTWQDISSEFSDSKQDLIIGAITSVDSMNCSTSTKKRLGNLSSNGSASFDACIKTSNGSSSFKELQDDITEYVTRIGKLTSQLQATTQDCEKLEYLEAVSCVVDDLSNHTSFLRNISNKTEYFQGSVNNSKNSLNEAFQMCKYNSITQVQNGISEILAADCKSSNNV